MCAPDIQQYIRPAGVAGPDIGPGVLPAGTDMLMSNWAASLGQGLQGRVSLRPGREKHEIDRPELEEARARPRPDPPRASVHWSPGCAGLLAGSGNRHGRHPSRDAAGGGAP